MFSTHCYLIFSLELMISIISIEQYWQGRTERARLAHEARWSDSLIIVICLVKYGTFEWVTTSACVRLSLSCVLLEAEVSERDRFEWNGWLIARTRIRPDTIRPLQLLTDRFFRIINGWLFLADCARYSLREAPADSSAGFALWGSVVGFT